MGRYLARSASDKTDNWPIWFVADTQRGGVNVVADLLRAHINPEHRGGVFLDRDGAEVLAEIANGTAPSPAGEAEE